MTFCPRRLLRQRGFELQSVSRMFDTYTACPVLRGFLRFREAQSQRSLAILQFVIEYKT